jgi:hypothetical protein
MKTLGSIFQKGLTLGGLTLLMSLALSGQASAQGDISNLNLEGFEGEYLLQSAEGPQSAYQGRCFQNMKINNRSLQEILGLEESGDGPTFRIEMQDGSILGIREAGGVTFVTKLSIQDKPQGMTLSQAAEGPGLDLVGLWNAYRFSCTYQRL